MPVEIDSFKLTIPEILSLLGLIQCVYILVYMLFRSGRLSRGSLPAIYFFVLGCAFFLDMAFSYLEAGISFYRDLQWLFWFLGPPLSTLLVIQIAQITKLPKAENFTILLLVPCAYLSVSILVTDLEHYEAWLLIAGLIIGTLSLLSIWLQIDVMNGLRMQVRGHERFWLIMALIIMNIGFLASVFADLKDLVSITQSQILRSLFAIGFVYVASTSLFRIYPQAVRLQSDKDDENTLSDYDIEIAMGVEMLMHRDKVYQEPNYGRSELAQELNIPEGILSRIVNIYFEKSVPQLLNEARVEDAKALLKQTNLPVKDIIEESGFNSVATFNRVFKEITELTPSEFRGK